MWKIENFKPVEVRDLSSFPMYKNRTLPGGPRSGGKKGGGGDKEKQNKGFMRSAGEGMLQGQAFLHSSHCYVILYKYGPALKKHIVYFWQGERSSHDDRAASALQAYRHAQYTAVRLVL